MPQRITPFHIGATAISLLALPAVIDESRNLLETQNPQTYCLTPEINSPDALTKAKQVFSENNIIHQVFSIESEIYCPQDVVRAYQILGEFLLEVKAELEEEGDSKDDAEGNFRVVQRLMEKRFARAEQEDANFMSNLIRRELDCDTSSLVVLALAQEFGWPVKLLYEFGYHNVDHVIARWGHGITSTNWDTRYRDPVVEWSYKPYHFRARRELDYNGVLSLAYTNRAYTKSDRDDYQGAIKDLETALELFSQHDSAREHLKYCRKQFQKQELNKN